MDTKTARESVRLVVFHFNENDDAKKIEFDSFLRAFKLSEKQIDFLNVCETAPTSAMLDGVNGVVIAGSRRSVWEELPNNDALVEVIKTARAKHNPIMGVCFGAQFLAHVFGGKVVRDDEREELGTFGVAISEESSTDTLFADSPSKFWVQCSHHDRITVPPLGAKVLASSERCSVQAFVIPGADIYGVQFHPERSKSDFQKGLALRTQLEPAKKAKFEAAAATLQESPEAEAILEKFVDRMVLAK